MLKYQITLNEKQLATLIDACDLLSRVHNVQMFSVTEHLPLDTNKISEYDLQKYIQNLVDPYIDENKRNQNDIAYDMQKVFRHRLAWDRNPKGGVTVNFDTPFQSSSEPLPMIMKIEE